MPRWLWLGVGILLGVALPAVAQVEGLEGYFESSGLATSSALWHSQCERPDFAFEDAEEAQGTLERFRTCLQEEVENDTRVSAHIIYADAQRELAEAQRAAKNVMF